MKRTKKPNTRTARTRKPQAQPVIPPLVAAIAHSFDPDYPGVHPTFRKAWQAAPTIVDGFARGEHDAAYGPTKYNFIRACVDADIARLRAESVRLSHLPAAIDLLERTDEDFRTDIEVAHVEPAFHLGLAVALYLMTNDGGAR